MRKLLSIILVTTLVLTLGIIPSYADEYNFFVPPGLAKKGGLPPGLAKKFSDIEGYQWAIKAIEKMAEKGIIKGVDDDKFAPAKSVTKVEALAMIMRVLEWEDDADEYKKLINEGKKNKKVKGKVQDWGIGYIELAHEIGLLDEVDLLQQNFNQPATRQEVAKYIIRALDIKDEDNNYVEEAKDNMDVTLRFKDASAVQLGSVGYVYLIDKIGIMVGNTDNAFQPNKPVSRAEMATLIERLDGKVENDLNRITGFITDLEDDEIEIEINGKEEDYGLVDEDDLEIIDVDGDEIEYSDLEEGMKVKLYFEDDEVVKIVVLTVTDIISGKLVGLDDDEIEIEVNGRKEDYDLVDEDDLEVIDVDGDEIEYSDLEEGMKVKLYFEDDEVVKIVVITETEKISGKLVELDDDEIIVRVGSSNKTYDLDDEVEIYINDDEAQFDDLQELFDDVEDINVELTIENGYVTEMDCEYEDNDYNFDGTITNLYNSSKRISVKSGSNTKTFDVINTTDIEIDGRNTEFDKLVVGMEVELRIEDDKLVELYAQSIEEEHQGKLVEIKGGSQNKITIKIGTQEKTFVVHEDAEIEIDQEEASFADLFNEYNSDIEVETVNNIVVRILVN